MPCSYTNDIIELSSQQLCRYIDVKVTSKGQHFAMGLRKKYLIVPLLLWSQIYDVTGTDHGRQYKVIKSLKI